MEEVDKRQRVIQEIVQTEQTYVNRLQLLISMYIEPLKQQNIISDMDAQVLFNNWQIIEGLNRTLLRDLQASLEQRNDNFGSLFREFSPYFRMYSSYLNNYETALERRATLMTKNGQFARFLEQAQQDPRSMGLSIADLLIEPVQRIPRYKLLLEQLLKYTPESHPDYANIGAALESVSSAAQHNNEQIRRREMREQILQIMTQFDSSSEASLNLMDTPSRVFIREAVMQKLCRRGPKEFKFWLFNDKLLYGEQKASGKYCLNRDIELAACRVTTVHNAKAPDRAFMIESPSKSFVVWSNTPEERDEWLRDIENCIQVLREKYQQETGKIAPVWTPDSAVSKCQICGAKFGLVLRRHHCRQCGDVVCGNCSKRTMLLEHIDPEKPQRVCDDCYNELSGTGPEAPKDYGIVVSPPGVGFTPPTQPPNYKPRPPPPRDGTPNGEPSLARTQSTPVMGRSNPIAGFVLPPRPPVPLSKVGSTGDLKAAASSGPDASVLSSSPALTPPAPISKIAPGAQAYAQAVGGSSPPAQSSLPAVPPPRPPPPRPPGHASSLSMGAVPFDAAATAAGAEPVPAAGAGLTPPPPLSKVQPGAEAYAAATGASQPPAPPPKPEKPPTLPSTPPPPTPPTPTQPQQPAPPSSPPPAQRPTSQPPKPPVPSMPRPAAGPPAVPATAPPSVPSSAPPSVPPSAPPKPPKLSVVPEPAVISSTRPRSPNSTSSRPRPPGARGGPSAAARAASPTAKSAATAAAAPAPGAASAAAGAPIPFEQLKNMTMEMMPPGVDYTQREILLSDEEFSSLFGCTKAEFNNLPPWKRNNKKKALGLF